MCGWGLEEDSTSGGWVLKPDSVSGSSSSSGGGESSLRGVDCRDSFAFSSAF